MQVVLTKRVINLGYEWDVVKVKPGYARNYLIPQNLAEVATPALVRKAQKLGAERLKKMEEVMANAKEMAEKLSKITLHFSKKAKGDKLFGSITEKDIAEALTKEHKIEVTKEMVQMDKHLKTIGDHKVNIHLTEGVNAKVGVKVEGEK